MLEKLKMSKKTFVIIISCLIVAVLAISVAALINNRKADKIIGSHQQEILNRINFLVENTEFIFLKTQEIQEFELDIAVSATKTEADFYGIINSISFSGLPYTSSLIIPADLPHAVSLPNAALPVVDGKPETMTWNISVTFNAEGALEEKGVVSIFYTSGVKEEAANSHAHPIEIKVSVLDQYPLLEKIAEAKNFIEENSSESLGSLKSALSKAEDEITKASSSSQENLNSALDKLQTELDKLV